MQRRRAPRSPAQKLALFAIAIFSLLGGYYWGSMHAVDRPEFHSLSRLPEPRPLLPFSLQDQYGNPVDESALIGHWNLLLFGYGHDTTDSSGQLTLAARILNRLADHPLLQQNIRVWFVTLDPERDSATELKAFVGRYHPDFMALRGSLEQIRKLARQTGIRFQHQPATAAGDYRIDHSTSFALVAPDGRFVGLFTGLVDAVSIAGDLKQLADTY